MVLQPLHFEQQEKLASSANTLQTASRKELIVENRTVPVQRPAILEKQWWTCASQNSQKEKSAAGFQCIKAESTWWTVVKWVLIVVVILVFGILLVTRVVRASKSVVQLGQRLIEPSIFRLNPRILSQYPSIVGLPEVIRNVFAHVEPSGSKKEKFTARHAVHQIMGYPRNDYMIGMHQVRETDSALRVLAQPLVEIAQRNPLLSSVALDLVLNDLFNAMTVSPQQMQNMSYVIHILETTGVLPRRRSTLTPSSYLPILKTATGATPLVIDAVDLANLKYPVELYPDADEEVKSFQQIKDNVWRGQFRNRSTETSTLQRNMAFASVFNQQISTVWMQKDHPDKYAVSNGIVHIQYNGKLFEDPASFLVELVSTGHRVNTYVRTRTHDFFHMVLLSTSDSAELQAAEEKLSLATKREIIERIGARGNYSDIPTAVMIRTGIANSVPNAVDEQALFPAIESAFVIQVISSPSIPKNLSVGDFSLTVGPGIAIGGNGFWSAESLDSTPAWVGEHALDYLSGEAAAKSVFYAQTAAVLLNVDSARYKRDSADFASITSPLSNDLVALTQFALSERTTVYPVLVPKTTLLHTASYLRKTKDGQQQEVTILNRHLDKLFSIPDDSQSPVAIESVATRILQSTPYGKNAEEQVFVVGVECIQTMNQITPQEK